MYRAKPTVVIGLKWRIKLSFWRAWIHTLSSLCVPKRGRNAGKQMPRGVRSGAVISCSQYYTSGWFNSRHYAISTPLITALQLHAYPHFLFGIEPQFGWLPYRRLSNTWSALLLVNFRHLRLHHRTVKLLYRAVFESGLRAHSGLH